MISLMSFSSPYLLDEVVLPTETADLMLRKILNNATSLKLYTLAYLL